MAKTCPSCGYNPIGPFTDNCPVCAEPVRNVRSDAYRGSIWPVSVPLWVKWVVGGVVATVLGVLVCCGLGTWMLNRLAEVSRVANEKEQAAQEEKRKARTVIVAAAPLLQEFRTDAAAANQKYKGKYLEISGVVERVGRDPDNVAFVILTGGDENANLKIECFFESADRKDLPRIQRLEKGQTITVRGEYDGQVNHVQVRECKLAK